MKPVLAITRRLVIAISVDLTVIQAATRKKRPTTTIESTRPSTMSPNCDHHEMRAR
jgi:hypothetical protein